MRNHQRSGRLMARMAVAVADMTVLAMSAYVAGKVSGFMPSEPEQGVPGWVHVALPLLLLLLLLYVISARRKRQGATWGRICLRALYTSSLFVAVFIIAAFLVDNVWLSRPFMGYIYVLFSLLLAGERMLAHLILLRRRSVCKLCRWCVRRLAWMSVSGLFIFACFPFLCVWMAIWLKHTHRGAVLILENRPGKNGHPFRALVFNSPCQGLLRDLPILVNVFFGQISFPHFLELTHNNTYKQILKQGCQY